MLFKYVAAANSTTNGSAIAAAGQDIYVKKLIIGLPVASAVIKLYNKVVAYATDTSDIAFKLTIPSTITENAGTYHYQVVYDFTGPQCEGLQLDGGNIMVDQACDITLIYEIADQGK